MRSFGPGRPLVFNHIPKCAGTSLTSALLNGLQPTLPVSKFDTSLVGGYDDLETLPEFIRSTFVFAPEELPAEADFVTGHISPGTTMARFPEADHVTTLRNPRLRVLSQWIHSRALSDFDIRHWGKGEAFKVARKPFAEYLDHAMIAPNVDNTITRFLLWPHPAFRPDAFIDERLDDELYEAARERLDRFAHVGHIEDPAFLAGLSAWLGRELSETRLNERDSMPPARKTDLAAELTGPAVDLLDHRTRIDRRIWADVVRSGPTGAEPDELLGSTWDRAIARHIQALSAPRPRRPLKRTVELAYAVRSRLSRSALNKGAWRDA